MEGRGCVQIPQESITGRIKRTRLLHGYPTATPRLLHSNPTIMPGRPSIQSRALAHVRLQLKTGKTRGTNPRPLTSEEVCALEARRDELQAEMATRQRQRILSRVNNHTSQEAERTREVIVTELQPITVLVAGSDADSREERIKARNNQIALLQAANREDREAIRKERMATREANARAKAHTDKRRRTNSATGSTRSSSTADHWDGSECPPTDEEPDAANLSVGERQAMRRAELQECSVLAKVDQLMADIDARRDSK